MTTSSLNQYYTLSGGKVAACDGAGNTEPPGSLLIHSLPDKESQALFKILKNHEEN